MVSKLVFAGPASREIGEAIARKLNLETVKYDLRIFPDGESKIRFESDVQNKNIILVQSTHPPADRHIMQLFFASHYLSQEGSRVTAVIPYLAYARQDKQFMKGEVISISVFAHLLRASGVKRVVTVDIHSAEAMAHFPIPVYSVSAIPYIASYLKQNESLENPVVVAPDEGAARRDRAFASLINSELIILEKKRDRVSGEVTLSEVESSLSGRDAVIVDDIISTGGTIAQATEMLYRKGARKVIVCCTHALLVNDALEKLSNAGVKKIIATNTVPCDYSFVDVSDSIVSYLRTLDE